MSTTIRIDDRTAATLRELSAQTGEAMGATAARALEHYRRQVLLEQTYAAFAALRADPDAWREELSERAAWGI